MRYDGKKRPRRYRKSGCLCGWKFSKCDGNAADFQDPRAVKRAEQLMEARKWIGASIMAVPRMEED